MSASRFGAFIMTYERTAELAQTVTTILSQTHPPEKIVIVDNSDSQSTSQWFAKLNDPRVEYHHMGYNAGPAGAAFYGLTRLASEGFDFIFWGDDNDPPDYPDAFEILLTIFDEVSMVGMVGMVGHHLNNATGLIVRVPDQSLLKSKYIEVDSIAGNQSIIVNAEVVRRGVLPDAGLFFGFEELDFCLKVKRASYKLVVPSELYRRAREKYNRVDYKPPLYILKSAKSMWRQFYSVRNLLWILKRQRFYKAFIYQIAKNVIKSLYGFRYGFGYGARNFVVIFKGITQGILK